MFEKRYAAKVFIFFILAVMLAACSVKAGNQQQGKETKKRLTAVEVLQKANDAINRANGISAHLTGKQKFVVTPAQPPFNRFEVVFDTDLESDPKGEHVHIKGNELFFSMKVPIHVYLDQTDVYQEFNGKWYKYPKADGGEPFPSVPQNDPKAQLELYFMISKEAPQALKLQEENGNYVIRIDTQALSEKAQQKLLEHFEKEIGVMIEADPKKNQAQLKLLQFSENLVIDKVTFVPKNMELSGKMEISEPQIKKKGTAELQFDVLFKKGLDKPVTVPEDVKKKAEDMAKLNKEVLKEWFNSMIGGMPGEKAKGINP